MRRFDAVIFDCDGVLVDSEPIAARVLAEALTRIGCVTSLDDVYRDYLGRSHASVEDGYRSRMGRSLPATFRSEADAVLFDAFRRGLQPIEGVVAVLSGLNVRYAVASSSAPSRLALSLSLTGLDRFFEGRIFDASMVARGKPAPDLFLHAAGALGATPARTLVIEDSRFGIEAAQAAGMVAWGFIGGGHYGGGRDGASLLTAGAERLVGSMNELLDLFALHLHESG